MAKVQIKHRFTDAVLFAHETTDERMASGLAVRDALESASKSFADLRFADLRGADLNGADLRFADLRFADLRFADLNGADLRFADLRGADLNGADLNGADLNGAKWSNTITINRVPMQLYGLRWPVTILDNHMQIGCQLHTLSAWDAFDDDEIIRMDGRDALRFWRAHKDSLLALARADGRGVTTETEAAHVAQ